MTSGGTREPAKEDRHGKGGHRKCRQEKGRVLRGLLIRRVSGWGRSGAHDLADVIEEAVDTLAQSDRLVGQIAGRLADVAGGFAGLAGRV